MSRAIIGAILGTLIAIITGAAYFVTTSTLKDSVRDDLTARVAKAQELLIRNSSLEILKLLKHAEALALHPKLKAALEGADGKGADPVVAEAVFREFRASLQKGEAQPDIMALTDESGRLIALMSGSKPVTDPVPDTYISNGKIEYPALEASLNNQVATSEIWDYEGSGAMKVTVAPILDPDPEVNATMGAVLVAYAITAPEAQQQEKLIGAKVVYFYDKAIQTSSFGGAKEQQSTIGEALFGTKKLAEQALTSEDGYSDVVAVNYNGEEYLATAGKLPRYSNKKAKNPMPDARAGAMVLISFTQASSGAGTAGVAILVVGLFGIIVLVVGISLTARRILHPLEEIELGVNDIINGNLDRTFLPVGSDLDGLANALNVMLARLLGRPEPGEEEFDDEGNIIRKEVHLPNATAVDAKQAEAEALAAEPMETYLRRIHGEFVAAQKAQGIAEDVDYDEFVRKLMGNEAALKQKYGAREVRFKVVVDGDKVTLKPVPIM